MDNAIETRRQALEDERRRRRAENYLEIRGVEYMEVAGRVDVVRHLCLPCRRFFRSRETFESHDC